MKGPHADGLRVHKAPGWQRFGASARTMSRCALALLVLLFTFCLGMESAFAKYKFCAKIQPVFQDSGIGEDYLDLGSGGTIPAYRHYMKLRLNGVTQQTGYGDSQGCIAGEWSAAGTWQLIVYTTVGILNGSSLAAEIKIYRADTSESLGVWQDWTLPSSTTSAITTKTLTIAGTSVDGLFRVGSVMTLVPLSSVMTGSTFEVLAEWTGTCVACTSGTTVKLGTFDGDWVNKSKATIAHEFGHAIQDRLFSYFGGSVADNLKYCASVSQAECKCDHVADTDASDKCGGEQLDRLHCLGSREHFFAAFNEGWGHFYASVLLNIDGETDAFFPYYKESIHANGITFTPPPVPHNVLPSTPYTWMEDECSDTMAARGTEMDWLSFLYHVKTQTSDAYSFADFRTVMRSTQVCDGNCTTSDNITWTMMVAGVVAQPTATWSINKKNHFIDSLADYGINH